MEPLVTAFVAAAVGHWGERGQLLVGRVSGRSGRPAAALLGFTLAAIGCSVIAVFGGMLMHPLLTPQALGWLLGLALAYAGIIGFALPASPDKAARFKGGPLLTGLIFGGVFLLQGRVQFITLCVAARSDEPWLTAAGAAAGLVAASLPAAMLGRAFPDLPLRPIRYATSGLLLVAGVIVALIA